jgi:hypothetical protein
MEPQVPPQRFAPVGRTKGRAALTSAAVNEGGTMAILLTWPFEVIRIPDHW